MRETSLGNVKRARSVGCSPAGQLAVARCVLAVTADPIRDQKDRLPGPRGRMGMSVCGASLPQPDEQDAVGSWGNTRIPVYNCTVDSEKAERILVVQPDSVDLKPLMFWPFGTCCNQPKRPC
jgi:hypothetical protein